MVTHEWYQGNYSKGGDGIPPEEWPRYEAQASAQLEQYKRRYTVTPDPTDCRPDCFGVPWAEAMAVCAMAEAMHGFEAVLSGSGGPVTSASIGSVSVSYGGTVGGLDVSAKGQAQELYHCASLYLDICRGVG